MKKNKLILLTVAQIVLIFIAGFLYIWNPLKKDYSPQFPALLAVITSCLLIILDWRLRLREKKIKRRVIYILAALVLIILYLVK